MISSELRLTLLLLPVLAACARGPGAEHDPLVERLVPSRGHNTARVAVRVEGVRFFPLATHTFGADPPVAIDRGFFADLAGVPLEELRWVSDTSLEGVVPAGLPAGYATLTLTGPLGRVATLERAWLSSDQPFAAVRGALSAERARVVVGQPFTIALVVTNGGGLAAAALTAQLVPAGPAFEVLASPPEAPS